jgi:hypothetical protein
MDWKISSPPHPLAYPPSLAIPRSPVPAPRRPPEGRGRLAPASLLLSAPCWPNIRGTAPGGWPQFAVQPRSLQLPRGSAPSAAFCARTGARPRNRGQPLPEAPTHLATRGTLFCQFSGRFANVLDLPAQKGASLCLEPKQPAASPDLRRDPANPAPGALPGAVKRNRFWVPSAPRADSPRPAVVRRDASSLPQARALEGVCSTNWRNSNRRFSIPASPRCFFWIRRNTACPIRKATTLAPGIDAAWPRCGRSSWKRWPRALPCHAPSDFGRPRRVRWLPSVA